MTTSTQLLVDRLVDTYPELRTLRREHVDTFGELLPHVLFGELTAWLVNAYIADPEAGPEAASRRILADLERDSQTGDPMSGSCCTPRSWRTCPTPDEDGAGIAAHLGPRLATDLADFR